MPVNLLQVKPSFVIDLQMIIVGSFVVAVAVAVIVAAAA